MTSPIKFKKVIDLTHNLHEKIPSWSGKCCFHMQIGGNHAPDLVATYHFPMSAAGTHMDAPIHFIKGGATMEQIPVENLVAPLHVIDVTTEAHEHFFLQPSHIEAYEKEHGPIEPNSLVAMHSGWDKYWTDPKKYIGDWEYPGFSKEVAELLLKRKIAGIGTDAVNPDGNDKTFPVHYTILGAGKYIVENLTNLDKVPPAGALAIVLPLKIQGAPEAPIRAIALI